jgi:hypothetical protein
MGSPALEFPLMVGEVVMVIEEAVVTVVEAADFLA